MSETIAKYDPIHLERSWTNHIVWKNGNENVTKYSNTRDYANYSLGVKNPRWKDQIKRGQQAGTSFTGELYTVKATPFYAVEFLSDASPLESRSRYGVTLPELPDNPYSLSETKANNQAKEKHVRKIVSKQTRFQGGTFLGELARTAALIANPASAIRKGVNQLHRRTVNRLKGYGRSVNRLPPIKRRDLVNWARDTWLEYQLGWAPLLSEIDDGAKTLADMAYDNSDTFDTVRSIGTDKEVIISAPQLNRPAGGFPRWKVEKRITHEVTVRYISCIDVGLPTTYNFRNIGLTPDRWLPTVWELIPYSFVIDYFSNVGDIIQAASLARSTIRWTIKTVRKSTTIGYYSWRPEVHSTSTLGSNFPGTSEITRRQVDRSIYDGHFVPTLEINLPRLGTQWLNIAGLLDARRELKSFYR
jgi:hypothetical protein